MDLLKGFFTGLLFLSNIVSTISLNCISLNNQSCKVRPEIINVILLIKDLNVKVFNLMSRANEIKNIKWHETCKCECRLDAIVCNNKQRWNKNKCRCECQELLIHKSVRDKDFIWNRSNCECECNKACDFSAYLDYKNYKCKKKFSR